MRTFSVMMVDHLADPQNSCADVFGQMRGTDVQMMLSKQITADDSVRGQGSW